MSTSAHDRIAVPELPTDPLADTLADRIRRERTAPDTLPDELDRPAPRRRAAGLHADEIPAQRFVEVRRNPDVPTIVRERRPAGRHHRTGR